MRKDNKQVPSDLFKGLVKLTTRYDNGNPLVICHHLDGVLHGKYEKYFMDGKTNIVCFYHNDYLHGEYKMCSDDEKLYMHRFYQHGEDITVKIKKMVSNVENLTESDKIAIILTHDIQLL